jgi:hypothetical protein
MLVNLREMFALPPYAMHIYLWLTDLIEKSETGQAEVTVMDMRHAFARHVGKRPVGPSYGAIRSAYYSLWEKGYLEFFTSTKGIVARYPHEDDMPFLRPAFTKRKGA